MQNQLTPPDPHFILYQDIKTHVAIHVRFEGDEVWLTQLQIALLFHTTRTNVAHHIRNIYQRSELQKERTYEKFSQVQKEGSRTVQRNVAHYNMDMIIAVGFRVNSAAATQFRQWVVERRKNVIIEKRQHSINKITKIITS
ncbi:MAG: virulence RhuM family protein [Dysgonamonadaceae bacterium]|jgi:hypothetical protein|nr:virulence RhuM family protein [Dysgonamonadaceae bacterium]